MVNGTAYLGGWDSYIYGLDGAWGEERWRFQAGDSVDSSPAVVERILYFGSWDGYVYAITEG